jgi:hypothetical protein
MNNTIKTLTSCHHITIVLYIVIHDNHQILAPRHCHHQHIIFEDALDDEEETLPNSFEEFLLFGNMSIDE